MRLDELLQEPGDWLAQGETQHPIVVSSRVRLARNLGRKPFPGWAKKADRVEVLARLKPEIMQLPQMQEAFVAEMQELSALEKQILVERHLISREHAGRGVGSGVVINPSATVSIMINEEDHLRMQSIRPGLDLQRAFDLLNQIDDALEDQLSFAFDHHLGFLTACPTNVGTGMRASAMLHLPGLVLADQMNQVVQSVNKIGLVVRGLYGEGTEALGNLFQISNQTTLGETEQEILRRLNEIVATVINHERNARAVLVEKRPGMLQDQIGRAYGILSHAWNMNSKEALNLLSLIKMGIDLGAFPQERTSEIDSLFTVSQPAHLQRLTAQKLSAEERDRLRAFIIREKLKSLPYPDNGVIGDSPSSSGAH